MLTATKNSGVCIGITVLGLLSGVPVPGMQKLYSTTGKFKISAKQFQQLTCLHQMFVMMSAQLVPCNWCYMLTDPTTLFFEAEQLFFNYRKIPNSYTIWIEGLIPALYWIVCVWEYVAMIAVANVNLSHVSFCKLFYPWAKWSALWNCKAQVSCV